MQRSTVLRILAVCVFALAGGLCGNGSASDYFPDVLSCGSWPDRLVPPADVLTQAMPGPPTPLFAESLQGMAVSAIASKWLPDRFDDAIYLAHGDGAYRARTAHLCLSYERSGCTVILKGFAGRLVAIVQPLPVDVSRDAYEELAEAATYTDPCEAVYPDRKEGVSAAVASLFSSLRDELLSPAAHPASAEEWNAMLNGVGEIGGGLQLYYGAVGPISDAAAPASTSDYGVGIWTDGDTAVVSIGLNGYMTTRNRLYKELQPVVDAPTEGLRLPYVSRIATAGEWLVVAEAQQEDEVPEECLAASQQQASHQKLYFDLGGGLIWMGLVPNPPTAAQIEEAAWLCLARLSVEEIASSHYPYWVNHQGNASPSEVVQRLRDTQARHLAALSHLEAAPCPASLRLARNSLLAALRVSSAIWEVALPRWESALSSGSGGAVDWDALRSSVNEELASKGLPAPPVGWDWGECWRMIASSERVLGIRTDSVHEP